MTLDASIEQCTSALLEEFGDALRVVAIGDGDADEYEIRHIRDDIAQQYPPPDRREIFEDALLEALARDSQEDLFRRGELEYTVRVFERGINVLCWIGDRRMLFVGLDRDPSLIHSASAYPRLQVRVKRTIAYTTTDDVTARFPTVYDSFKTPEEHSV